MKRCSSCKNDKEECEFYKSRKNKLGSYCKICTASYGKIDKAKNKERHKQQMMVGIDRKRDYIGKFLNEHPCVLCLESDLLVLTFDHLDTETKLFDVSEAIRR